MNSTGENPARAAEAEHLSDEVLDRCDLTAGTCTLSWPNPYTDNEE